MKKNNILVAVKAASSFEQGVITQSLSKFGLKIEDRGSLWISYSGKMSLLKSARLFDFLRRSDYEFMLKGTKA